MDKKLKDKAKKVLEKKNSKKAKRARAHAGLGKNQTSGTNKEVAKRKGSGKAVAKGTPIQRSGRPTRLGIDATTYHAMAVAYFEVQSVSYVADICNVNKTTARKYIEKGDPSRKLPAIKKRWEKQQKVIIKNTDDEHAKSMKQYLKMISNLKTVVAERIEGITPEDIPTDKLSDVVTKLLKAESFARGGPDQRIEHSKDPIDNMTPEELQQFLKTTQYPARFLGTMAKRDID